MLKIDIVSGFLGAGKTTFIKRLLKTNITKEKVVLIENEFGEVSIDGDLVGDAQINVQELSQGCICCSLAGDFTKSLQKVINDYNPDRILIEPSGVGKLSDVKKAVIDAGCGEALNSFICLVDAVRAPMYVKNFGEFFIDQIKNASVVVLSRTDVANNEKIEKAFEIVRGINTECNIVSTPINDLSDDALFASYEGFNDDFYKALMEEIEEEEEEHCCCHHHHHDDDEECECGHHHHHHDDDEECECGHHHHHHDDDEECECGCHHHHHGHDADEVFQSIGIESTKEYDLDSLNQVLDKLANTSELGVIVRAKGIIKTNAGWKAFNISPNEISVIDNAPIPTGKICVIGSNLSEEIKNLF